MVRFIMRAAAAANAERAIPVQTALVRQLVTILTRRQVVRHNVRVSVRRLVLKTAPHIILPAEVHCAQADKSVLTELVKVRWQQADIAVDTLTIVVIVVVRQVLMTAIASLTMVRVVIIGVKVMDGLIVMICMLVAGHKAVPRSSRIATATATTATTPTSVVSSRSRLLLAIYQFNNLKVVYK